MVVLVIELPRSFSVQFGKKIFQYWPHYQRYHGAVIRTFDGDYLSAKFIKYELGVLHVWKLR